MTLPSISFQGQGGSIEGNCSGVDCGRVDHVGFERAEGGGVDEVEVLTADVIAIRMGALLQRRLKPARNNAG